MARYFLTANDPFRPPATIDVDGRSGRPTPVSLTLGLTLWSTLAVAHLLAYLYLKPIFVDLDVKLPVLTRWLFHPMALVMFFTIALAVLLSGKMTENLRQRQRIGKLALVLGILTLATWVAAIILPVFSLWNALSS